MERDGGMDKREGQTHLQGQVENEILKKRSGGERERTGVICWTVFLFEGEIFRIYFGNRTPYSSEEIYNEYTC